ncbi:MAG: efflux RND transporter periplasmic adaptor subunit [Mucilaginibacter sp.]|uniref:efflux RND transporter periplasmic adaptor subunit n=1 Tax=Mucilaginibacter sp. TaxID=1882438 RepID=UPI0031B4B5FB
MKISYLAILVILAAGCKPQPQTAANPSPPSLPVTSLGSTSETTFQDYPASIQGTVNIEVRPQVSGLLDKIFVDEGSFVNAGQPLFMINEQPFRAALNNALATLHAAESSQANARLEVEKLTPLVQNKVVSEYQLKTAREAFNIATANIESAQASVSTARINLGYTLIKAPVSGYIGRLLKKQGSLVSPSDQTPLTDLSDVHEVHVYFSLGEKEFVNFKAQYPGETLKEKLKHLPPATLLLADNSEYPVKGSIDMIDGQFNSTTGAITLRASFPNKAGLLRSGNTGKLRLSLQHPDVILVPQQATTEMQDKIFVYTVSDSNKIKMSAITVSGQSGNNYLVKDGVKKGDRIVLSGIGSLQEGTLIHPEAASEKTTIAKN